MRKLWFVSLAVATALAIAPAAKADGFTFTFTSGPTGGGTLVGNAVGGHFNITSGSITVNGQNGTLIPVVAVPSNGTTQINVAGGVATYYYNLPSLGYNFTFDNQLTMPGTPHLDTNGFAFFLPGGGLFDMWYDPTGQGGYYYNIFSGTVTGDDWGWLVNPQMGAGGAPLTLDFGDIEATPEPSSLLLLGTGLLFMAGFLFRKAKPSMMHSV